LKHHAGIRDRTELETGNVGLGGAESDIAVNAFTGALTGGL
jgi:hypothetical protein